MLAALLENRDDPAQWTVYGDLLQTEGDPRGGLIALMLERERRPSRKLMQAERAYREQHAAQLLPRGLRNATIAWRRGFPSAVRIDSAELLSVVLDAPALRFVETAVLEIDEAEGWLAAFGNRTADWRRVHIASWPEGDFDLAAILSTMPRLEHLKLSAEHDYPAESVDWEDVAALQLRHLAIEHGGEQLGLAAAKLPVLEELRLLGETTVDDELFESELYARLRRIVVATGNPPQERGVPTVLRHIARDEQDDWETEDLGLIVIRQLVDASLVEDLAATITGLSYLSVSTGHVDWGPDPFTVVQLHGAGSPELLPYGLAALLEARLAPNTPIALYHQSVQTGVRRSFALGDQVLRGDLREVLDSLLGHDPGLEIHLDLIEAICCAREVTVIGGTARDSHVFTDIDPGSPAPPPEIDEFGYWPTEHEIELATDSYPWTEPVAETAEQAEVRSLDVVIEEVDEPDEPDDPDEDDDEDETPDGIGSWLRLLALWEERSADPDDDYSERWPDPELLWTELPDVATTRWDPTCDNCEQVVPSRRPCAWCGGAHCPGCVIVDEDGAWCTSCTDELAADPGEPTAFHDEIFDGTDESPPEVIDDDDADEYDEYYDDE